jgi:hypothetical protein
MTYAEIFNSRTPTPHPGMQQMAEIRPRKLLALLQSPAAERTKNVAEFSEAVKARPPPDADFRKPNPFGNTVTFELVEDTPRSCR